jgi:predicted amidophosphoribosyltransferase
MNQVINNFKKPMDRKNKPEWYFKEQAILKIAYWLISTTTWDKLKTATWVPMPPSKAKSDSDYDDRLWRVLLKVKENEASLDIRELLLAKSSREAAHNPGSVRPKVNDHINNFIFDKSQSDPKPRAIIFFDDIITSGAHFKAGQAIIVKEYSDVPIIGLFVARNVKIDDVI